MILSQKIEIYYKNSIENIKKCENKLEKAKMIKALICDLSGKGITIIASKLNMAFKTIKNYYLTILIMRKQKKKIVEEKV